MTFYLTYRPKTLSELDLDSVRESLTKIVASQNIPHAFLFAGPKGTGKTSAARVLAKILNCTTNKKYQEPCNKCDACNSIDKGTSLDVIEIDAASHRGIDDVRTLRDAVKLAPVSDDKKVYIIDEAHMLTTEASNALLKTLEEPPSHVIFVLATTNPEKLIPTIRSRCQIVQFKKAKSDEVKRSISRMAKTEKYKIDDDGLSLITKYSEGSFRDGAKLLEQLISEGVKPKPGDIKKFLEEKKVMDTDTLLSLIENRKLNESLSHIEDMAKSGLVFSEVLSSMITTLHVKILAASGIGEVSEKTLEASELITLIGLLQKAKNETPQSTVEQLPLELAVIAWCGEKEPDEYLEEDVTIEKVEIITKTPVKSENKPLVHHKSKKIKSGNSVMLTEVWDQILVRVKPVNTSIEALLRAAKPVEFNGDTLTLGVYYRFHKERLEEDKNKQVLERVIGEVLNKPVKVVCILSEPSLTTEVKTQMTETVLTETEDNDIVKVAKEIFEG